MNKIAAILLQALIWAFAGALYGGLFIALLGYAQHILKLDLFQAYLMASIIAGTVIAAFFGSMLVALGGTLSGILVAIGYQILFYSDHALLSLLFSAFTFGLIAGAFFTQREIRLAQPLAQASAGLLSGLIAAPLTHALVLSLAIQNKAIIAASSVAAVGLFYVIFIRHIPSFLKGGWALRGGGILVSGLIAGTVAAIFWLIGASSLYMIQTNPYQNILNAMPLGLAGGALGGALGGAVLESIGIKIEEHIY